MPYKEIPVRELSTGIIGGTADGAVTAYTFCDYDGDGEISTITSGWGGIALNDADDDSDVTLKVHGIYRLVVDANGTNIAPFEPIKPTTDGHGVLAEDDGDQYSAISLEASTTDDDNILVLIEHGYVAEAAQT